MIRTIFNGLNHYKVSAALNSYRLSPLAPHRVRFAPQNRLLESADCNVFIPPFLPYIAVIKYRLLYAFFFCFTENRFP